MIRIRFTFPQPVVQRVLKIRDGSINVRKGGRYLSYEDTNPSTGQPEWVYTQDITGIYAYATFDVRSVDTDDTGVRVLDRQVKDMSIGDHEPYMSREYY